MFSMTIAEPAPGEDAALEACLRRIARGDQEALALLYEKTRKAVYGFALSVVKHPQDAEDIQHDTYVQVWKGATSYQEKGKPMAWLLRITRNLSMDLLRRKGRVDTMDWEECKASFSQQSAVTAEDRITLAGLLAALGDEERQVVTLHALTGLKHREIAALLELPLSTVLSRYSRAIKKLQLAWKEGD